MCLYPIYMTRMPDGKVVPARYGDKKDDVFPVKCGKCIECCIDYSREWSFRCALEAEMYDHSIIVTFTYDDEHLPSDGKLRYSDFQDFLKRFRNSYKVRYLVSGEYGASTKRPHYHAILFGYCPSDMVFLKYSPTGGKLYTSKELSNIWQNGFCPFEMFSQRGAFYAVKYMQKWLYSNDKEYRGFLHMSLKPGIGAINPRWHKGISTDKLYVNGKFIKLPRYFLKLADKDGAVLDEIKSNRLFNAKTFPVDLIKRRKASKKYFRKIVKNSCHLKKNGI